MSSQVRKLEIGLVVFGLLAGFGATLAGITAFRNQHHPADRSAASTPIVIDSGSGGQPSPAGLDAQWATYSSRSTCADWAGGDGVSAIRLNSSQLAWFFSDTYLGPAGGGTGFSHLSGFVHNLAVVQTTTGGHSKFITLTGGGACRRAGQSSRHAAAVVAVPAPAGHARQRYWDADGTKVGPYVIKFYNRYLPGSPPFVPSGTVMARFPVSQLSAAGRGPPYGAVATPGLTVVPAYTPSGGGTPIVWGSALLRQGKTAYVYGWQSPDPESARQLYVARVPAAKLTDLAAWRFYAGAGQWAAGQASAQPVELPGAAQGVAAGFSVVAIGGRYWLIQQGVQAGNPDIDAYPAPDPAGPFDMAAGILLYQSADVGLDTAHDYRIMYEARAEPALSSGQYLVISYNVNSTAVTAGCVPMSAFTSTITQPRFIAVPRAAFAPGSRASLQRLRVFAGPSPYPSITQRNPSQWFNGWAYRGGCPPVPAVLNLAARQVGSAIWLEWPNAGLGLRYGVYVREAGGGPYALVLTVPSQGTNLRGLHRGVTYQIRIVPLNSKQHAGPAATTTITVR